MPVGIIAGTAVYDIPGVELVQESIATPYGEALALRGQGPDADLIFLPRHGLQHTIPPHRVNYRANLKALELLGVKHVLAANAVGSINPAIPPLSLVVVDDFLDFTSGRPLSFFDGGASGVKHVDMSQPYCEKLRTRLLELAPRRELTVHPRGIYVCTNGPRLESPAEIRMFGQLGGDVVGMTGVPEVTLARELDLCFAAVAFSINWAAGIEASVQFVNEGLDTLRARMLAWFIDALRSVADNETAA